MMFPLNKRSGFLPRPLLFVPALACAGAELAVSLLYYGNRISENGICGILWIASVILLTGSVIPGNLRKASSVDTTVGGKSNTRYGILLLVVVITLVYFVTHLVGYSDAPWNNYGLFDDAAWDIYIAQQRCFKGNIFEIIFWDEEIGHISRELLFHYYISLLFRIFGYNMFVFNMGLVFLGFLTVLFTALLAERMTGSSGAGMAAGLILNFLPLHYTQVFMGHRYAMCTPMMMISAYLGWRVFTEEKSRLFHAVTCGLFAGLTMESAIMGKQYIWALLASAVLYAAFAIRRRVFRRRNAAGDRRENNKGWIASTAGILTGYAVVCAPLYAYIWSHGDLYRIREASLTETFFERLHAEGFPLIVENLHTLRETVFAPHSWQRQFSADYPILTWGLFLLLAAGIILALRRKWFLPVLMVAIPAAGNCITIPYDFRLLICAPFLAILIMLPIRFLVEALDLKRPCLSGKTIAAYVVLPILIMGPAIVYLWGLAHDPQGQYYLKHSDLAVCRYIQDVAAGRDTPSIEMKKDEFHPPASQASYDTYAATYTSFAHIHAFLESYDAREILRLFGDFPYAGTDEETLRRSLKQTVAEYTVTDRDLMLVFEYDNKIHGILEELTGTGLTEEKTDVFTIDGEDIQMVRMKIKNEDLAMFQSLITGHAAGA